MQQTTGHIVRVTWQRFKWAVLMLLRSEHSGMAKFYGFCLVTGIVVINGLNVLNSYVGRDFISAIEWKDLQRFWKLALLYAGVFVASTIAATLFRFVEERLGLLWREQLTQYFILNFLRNRAYLLAATEETVANPDQRISEDVRAFATTTLSFLLLVSNGLVTVLSFSGVLFSISPVLFLVATGYAALGSVITAWLGKPLIRLNYTQLDLEANFRAELLHVRENADAIALMKREGRFQNRLRRRFQEVAINLRRIIAVNRNLSFFTNGYNYFLQLVPPLLVAPMFIRGEVEFGVITQSTMAFAMLMGAFSLVVTQFQSISAFTAVTSRLDLLSKFFEKLNTAVPSNIRFVSSENLLACHRLTLCTPDDGRVLLRELELRLERGGQMVVCAHEATPLLALFRGFAGLWPCGEGEIHLPAAEEALFLPEKPYWPPGSLRNALLRSGRESITPEPLIYEVLQHLGMEEVVRRGGGLDSERDWKPLLSLAQQHLLSLARLVLARPRVVFLDRPGSSLPLDAMARALELFRRGDVSVVVFSTGAERALPFDKCLEIRADGTWSFGVHCPEYHLAHSSPGVVSTALMAE